MYTVFAQTVKTLQFIKNVSEGCIRLCMLTQKNMFYFFYKITIMRNKWYETNGLIFTLTLIMIDLQIIFDYFIKLAQISLHLLMQNQL